MPLTAQPPRQAPLFPAWSVHVAGLACLLGASALAQGPGAPAPTPGPARVAPATPAPQPPALEPFRQSLPASAFTFDMVPVPGSPDGAIKPFWISRTEITWEAFDIFVYRLDEQTAPPGGPDAVSRPSKPYLPPDRGFGHEGFAAISMSFKNAREFCAWLSAKSGRRYRLPTEAEWEHAARAGADPAAMDTSSPLGAGVDATRLADFAWFDENADFQPHPVGTKKPNAWGLHDMLGNVQEWALAADGAPVTKGGSYRTKRPELSIAARVPGDPAWNNSDPQVPKSQWWLADAPFVGFRVVCEPPPPEKK